MRQCPVCNQEFEPGVIFCPTDGERLVYVGDESVDPLIGELVDNKYLVEEKVARGGTATVYRARHVQLQLSVALKVMHPHLTTDKTAVERFRREAFAAMHIRHPNAVAVLDFAITAEGMVYVVTEFLSGMTLRERIMSQHEFSLEEANEIMQQMCAAVAVAHKAGIIHRDLKPDNIFLHREHGQEIVKVLDFGIAKMSEGIIPETSKRLTRQGFVLGTPHYMSPEQCHGKQIDARTDVYSLGVILYELLTGVVPFNGRSYSAIAVKKVRENPRPTYELRSDIPPMVDAVVMHALGRRPEDRPDSVQMFARELEIAIRAVTEHEFAKLFQGASEQELEAAILLASEPGRYATGPLKPPAGMKEKRATGRYNAAESHPDSGRQKVAGDVAIIDIQVPKLSERSGDRPPAREQSEAKPAARTTPLTAPPIDESHPSVANYGELLQFTDDASQMLNQEMRNIAHEMSMLLQIVLQDLDSEKPLDRVFFAELRSTVDALRAVMFHLHQHDQKHNS